MMCQKKKQVEDAEEEKHHKQELEDVRKVDDEKIHELQSRVDFLQERNKFLEENYQKLVSSLKQLLENSE